MKSIFNGFARVITSQYHVWVSISVVALAIGLIIWFLYNLFDAIIFDFPKKLKQNFPDVNWTKENFEQTKKEVQNW